jgi:hypothetical protein
MFISDRLVFTELHKTGGTHICRLLNTLIGGEQKGKHNRIPPHLWDRFIIGSIRNPWDWYVSLWAFGCGAEGSVFMRTTRRIDFKYLSRQLHSEMGQRRLGVFQWIRQLSYDVKKPVALWGASYGDSSEPQFFRKWLHLILNPNRRFDVGEGFGFSPVAKAFGLMTYRYLKLFTSLGHLLYEDFRLATYAGIRNAYEKKRLVNFVIRNECLEQDLLEGLKLAGYSLKKDDKLRLLTGSADRTNLSKHRPSAYYYDDETIALVSQREKLIVDIYNYKPPAINGKKKNRE